MLAQLTGAREFKLDSSDGPGPESRMLADATTGLAEHYSIPISAKRVAELNFATALLRVYSPRVMAWRMRRNREKAETSGAAPPRPVAVPPRPPVVPAPPRPTARPEPPQGFAMPTPANQSEVSPSYLKMSPSDVWSEPAADFPGIG
jgi:hypothetical protein